MQMHHEVRAMTNADASSVPSEFDVVVIGSGLSGLVAANVAIEKGASVLVLEKLSTSGGSANLASGHVWHSYPLREEITGVDPVIQGMVSRDFDSIIVWLKERGVHLIASTSRTNGYQIDPEPTSGVVKPLLERFKNLGGTLMLNTAATSLQRSASGVVEGVQLEPPAHFVRAGAVIVATGGFQGDPELVTRYIAPAEKLFYGRSTPGATGDGFRMGVSVGVAATPGLGAFYGHLSPHDGARPARIEPATYRRATLGCIEHVVLLNLEGKRFVDESRPDVAVAQALARDERAVGIAVFDAAVHDQYVTQRNALPEDARSALVLWEAVGGRVDRADTLPELFEGLSDAGLDVKAAIATMDEYERAAIEGNDNTLPVSRGANIHRCSIAPFFAMLVCPDVTFTEGGLRVDESCQALDADGEPISGLYVVGEAAGLVSLGSQAGGIATALSTGLRAGAHVTRTFPAH
jgi:succinate dehydrogenase/fumarate reductase flavoprotein subunit